MATTDNTQDTQLIVPTYEEGKSIPLAPEQKELQDTDPDALVVTSAKDEDGLTDADKALASKADSSLSNDFFDRFLQKREQAEFVSDLQSADTYWKNRPEERKKYEDQYGDKAREAFDNDYNTKVEPLWRNKLAAETDKVVLNSKYDWLFGESADISYDEAPTFEMTNAIFNGARRLDTMMTDKQVSDSEAAIGTKTFMNDKGELVDLKEDEKWYTFSTGSGVEMDENNPKYQSADGRKIVGFELVPFDKEYTGKAYLKALYDGDKPKGQIISMWDTTTNWLLKSNTKTSGSIFKMIPKTLIRTTVNLAADMATGTTSMLGSIATLFDADDDNAFIRAMNNTSTAVKARKISTSEYDQSKLFTTSNMLDFVAQVASQIYMGAGLFAGVNKLTRVLRAGNPLLQEAAKLEQIGDLVGRGRKIAEFEMKYGRAARASSLIGLTVATGDQVVTEARQAGFSEDEVASTYIAYFGAMMGANLITMRMIDPYLDNAAAAPFMRETIRENIGLSKYAKTDKALYSWARNTVQKMADGVQKLPKVATHTPKAFRIRSLAAKGLNEALEEEAEWFGQEAVELGATLIARRTHKGESEVPKFDIFTDDGYWARQLPNIAMSGIGGFMGGTMTHFLPGFENNNEESFLIKGDDAGRMMRVAMTGGKLERSFFKTKAKMKASGGMGSHLLSIKMNDKTGAFYKMTDAEAADSVSHAEAADRAITSQYLYYKTLYGGAQQSYDEILEADTTLAGELSKQRGHVLHKELIDLHDSKLELLKELNPNIVLPAPGTEVKEKKAVAKETTAKPVKEEKEPKEVKDPAKAKAGEITVEPEVIDKKVTKKIDSAYAEEVKTRAAALGTTDYASVKKLINIENKIDDILSGNAAAKHVVRSIIRSKNVGVFIPEQLDEYFKPIIHADGSVETNPMKDLGDDLLDMLFDADRNLAAKHAEKHAQYISSAKTVNDILMSTFTAANVKTLADIARKNPKSIAINRNTMQLKNLSKGVDNMISALIGTNEFAMLVTAARTKFKLDKKTEDYIAEVTKLIEDAQDEGELAGEGIVSPEQIKDFVGKNVDILHKLAISTLIDELIDPETGDKIAFLAKNINISDKAKFAEKLTANMSASNNIQVIKTEGSDALAIEAGAEKKYKDIMSEFEQLILQEPKTSAEKEVLEDKIAKLQIELSSAKSTLDAARRASRLDGNMNIVIGRYGADAINEVSRESEPGTLTPVAGVNSPALTVAKELIENYGIIVNNVAPVVPSVPKNGAVFNLLNVVSLSSNSVVSSNNKIIHETDESQDYVQLDDGRFVKQDREPSEIELLEASIIGDAKSDTKEFRNIEGAKKLLEAINIRLGQLDVIRHAQIYLKTLQEYSDEHMPKGKTRYDALPRFMSEYIFDAKRWSYLSDKAIRTDEEEKDYNKMWERLHLLVDYDNPESLHYRLTEAKERAEDLISMGEKSLDKNERFRTYKAGVAKHLNDVKKALSKRDVNNVTTPELDIAIAAFTGLTDSFSESNDDQLKQGKDALDSVLRVLGALPQATKITFLKHYSGLYNDNTPYQEMFVCSLATTVDDFNKYYTEVLTEVSANPKAIMPTYEQEQMIRSVFSYLTDSNSIFKSLMKQEENIDALFVNGASGTGKTTMIGYAIAAAQKYLDANMVKPVGYNAASHNGIIMAGMESHQAKRLKTKVEGLGVRGNSLPYMNKFELFAFLQNPANEKILSGISIIAFDEATFIQGFASDGKAEINILSDILAKLNSTRPNNPIRFVGIGDEHQGGWQEGMPTVSNPGNPGAVLNYSSLGARYTMFEYTFKTKKLEYSFRTLCEKTGEIYNVMLDVSSQQYSLFDPKKTMKIKMSKGVINNDVDDRGRWGGAEVVRSRNDLYTGKTGDELAENIQRQLNVDETKGLKGTEAAFSALIVDNDITSLEELPDGRFKTLVLANKDNFTLRNIESVQGDEADYVIANLTELFPPFPITSQTSSRLQKAAMVISRARLFAKIAVSDEVNLEQVDDAIISMLTPTNSEALTKTWNDFYRNKLWGVTVIPTASTGGTTDTGTTTTESGEKADDTKTGPKGTVEPPVEPPSPDATETHKNQGHTIVVTEVEADKVIIQTAEFIDKNQAQIIIDENNKTINDALASDIKKKEAEEEIKRVSAEAVNIANIFEPEANDLIDLDKITSQDRFADVIKDKAITQAEHLENVLGFIYGYTNMGIMSKTIKGDKEYINNQKINFASDIYGRSDYKTDKFHPQPAAIDEINALQYALREYSRGEKSAIDGYTFFLVSFQTHNTLTNTDEIVHQIYAQKGPNGRKIPAGLLPYKQLASNGIAKAFLDSRSAIINDSQQSLKLLSVSKDKNNDPLFTADNLPVYFGNSGVELSTTVIDKINSDLKEIKSDTNAVFHDNSGITKIGRVAVSDETVEYKEKNKIAIDNLATGLLYLETKLGDVGKVIQAVTPGAPMRGSEASKNAFADYMYNESGRQNQVQLDYHKSLPIKPTDNTYYRNKEFSKLKTLDASKKTIVFNNDTLQASKNLNLLVGYDKEIVEVGKEPIKKRYHILKVGGTYVYSFKGTNDRTISVYSPAIGQAFKLMFGFDSKGNPVGPSDKMEAHIGNDLDVSELIHNLGKNNLAANSVQADILEVSKEEANRLLGSLHKYDYESIKKYSTESALLLKMSEYFVANKMIYFDDLKIPISALRSTLSTRGAQLSAPISWTKTTKGNHQGKVAVLYTFHDKGKYDLSNTDVVSRLLKAISNNKATDTTSPELFDPKIYTKYGVGMIMLDSKMTSLTELLSRFDTKDRDNINRSSSPIGSYANQRLVNFIKELTVLIHDNGGAQTALDLGLHTRLASMGIDPNTKTYLEGAEVFDEAGRTALKAYFNTLAPEMKSQLKDLLSGITADENLGLFRIAGYAENSKIINELLSIQNLKDRIAYWETEVVGKVTPEEIAIIDRLNLGTTDGRSLSIGLMDQKTIGTVRAGLLVNPNTGKPLIITDGNAITYIPDNTLGTNGVTAEIHVFDLIKQIKRIAAGKTNDAAAMAGELDFIMRNYTKVGSLHQGVPWYGRTIALDNSLGMGVVIGDDVDLFLTSVKDIREPAMLVNVNQLIADVTRTPEKMFKEKVPNNAKINKDVVVKDIKSFIDKIINEKIVPYFVSKSVQTITQQQLDEVRKTVEQYIASKESLLANKNLTTIEIEDLMVDYDKKVAELIPKPLESEEELETINYVVFNVAGYINAQDAQDEATARAHNLSELTKDINEAKDTATLKGLLVNISDPSKLNITNELRKEMIDIINQAIDTMEVINTTSADTLGSIFSVYFDEALSDKSISKEDKKKIETQRKAINTLVSALNNPEKFNFVLDAKYEDDMQRLGEFMTNSSKSDEDKIKASRFLMNIAAQAGESSKFKFKNGEDMVPHILEAFESFTDYCS